MVQTVKLSGFKELDDALVDLTRAAAKGVLRRSLIDAAQPMARTARQLAPKATFNLSESITVSTKLTKRQASLHKRMFRDDRASVEVFVGPGPDRAGDNQEFGNIYQDPQPFLRPAFDQHKNSLIDRLKVSLSDEINKAAARAARKAAKG